MCSRHMWLIFMQKVIFGLSVNRFLIRFSLHPITFSLARDKNQVCTFSRNFFSIEQNFDHTTKSTKMHACARNVTLSAT